jgi:hypothetical protein
LIAHRVNAQVVCSSLRFVSDHPDDAKASTSRLSLRKEEAQNKDLQRIGNCDKYQQDAKRGVSMATQINLATIDLRERELEVRKQEASNQERENMLLNLNLQIHNMYKMLDRCEARAKQFCLEYDKEHPLWRKVLEQELLIEQTQEKMDSLSRERENVSNGESVSKKRKHFDLTTPTQHSFISGTVSATKTPPPSMINLSYDDTSGEELSIMGGNGVDV